MAITKYASIENVQVLNLLGSTTQVRHASLGKLADFHQYRTDDGYLYARIRAISSRVNKNHDGWPSIELAGGQDVFDRHRSSVDSLTVAADSSRPYGFSTFLGKPIFVDHHNSDPDRARGAIVDAKLHVDDHKTAASDPYYSSAEVDPEHLPGTWVELLLEVDAKNFPKFAKAIVEGSRNPRKGIDGWSMGCDVEKSVCSICKHAASSPEDYCDHIKMKGAYFDHVDPRSGHKTSKKAYENCYGVGFFEISGVFDPADETALSLEHARTSATKELEDADPKKKPLKDLADLKNEEWLEESGEAAEKRKKKAGPIRPVDQMSGKLECPNCVASGRDELGQPCAMCSGQGYFRSPNPGGDGYSSDPLTQGYNDTEFEPDQFGPAHHGSVHTAENPLPQSEMSHAPEPVDTLRAEEICPVCGSSMDEDTCDVCGYQEPPDGFGNPDLTKAQDQPEPEQPAPDQAGPELEHAPTEIQQGDAGPVNTPSNPTSLAHVTSDMEWALPRSSARINKVERPLISTNQPQTNEPQEKILSDQLKPVTSRVRTAEDFIAAAGTNRRTTEMNHTADAAEAIATPDVKTDVLGVGGVDQASNDAASKADAQVDVLAIGGTGVEGVAAEKEGVNVEQGDEHSKNIEAIPTKTWSGDGPGNGDSLGQGDPVTSEPFPASEDGVHASSWVVEGYDDGVFPDDGGVSGGSAVKGVKPIAEQFGDRVNVLEHLTSPSNNSGPTKTWTGTEGNGVLKQQDPVTPESIALGESQITDAPNWTASTHIFAAFKLADLEVELGLLAPDQKYPRAAELETQSSASLAASLTYAQRVKKAGVRRATGATKLPAMGRSAAESEANTAPVGAESVTDDASFMFGGI